MTNQTPNVFEHHTYNMTFALVSLAEGFAVYVCHPENDDCRLWSPEEIEDCEGHLFLITDHGMPVVNPSDAEDQPQ